MVVTTLPTVLSDRDPCLVAVPVSEKEGSVVVTSLPTVLSDRVPCLVAVLVSEKEGSVGVPTLPAVLSARAPGLVAREGGQCGYTHTARSFVSTGVSAECASSLFANPTTVAIFQFFQDLQIRRIFEGFPDEQLKLEP